MDIPELSMALSQSKVVGQIGTAVLSMALDHFRQEGAKLTELMDTPVKEMELSVHPDLGSNIDISI